MHQFYFVQRQQRSSIGSCCYRTITKTIAITTRKRCSNNNYTTVKAAAAPKMIISNTASTTTLLAPPQQPPKGHRSPSSVSLCTSSSSSFSFSSAFKSSSLSSSSLAALASLSLDWNANTSLLRTTARNTPFSFSSSAFAHWHRNFHTCSNGSSSSSSSSSYRRQQTPLLLPVHHQRQQLLLRPTYHQQQQQQRRFMTKDTMGLGITVTRKKGKETGYCYGCGADLVREGSLGETKAAPKKKGFWADQKDTLKKAQIKNWALCPRCRKLKQLEEGEVSINESMSKELGPNHLMTEVFRTEVGTIRTKEKVVVVLCIDAINVSGTLIRTIRNYVGGNPILLAITRCDLLPDYVYEDKTISQLKKYFLHRCSEIQPAAVYLCSEDKHKMQEVGGIKELASDLWEHLNGRDPYVIGAANIGKSTLTDILIAGFINRGERMGYFRDRLATKRIAKLREARITKSSLPGTTLQNIRVPCFIDHHHALWDTPGLLLDESTAHFPIRNFRQIRAQRPTQIVPHIYAVPKKSFCLILTEKDDEFPLLRVEIRLKKEEVHDNSNLNGSGSPNDDEDDRPVNVIWNSTLDLDTHIVEIKEAHLAEQERFKRCILDTAPTPEQLREKLKQREQQEEDDNDDSEQQQRPRTEEEKKRRKEERQQAYLARVKAEQEELGKAEWYRREEERKRKFFDEHRSKVLAKLVEVNQVVVDAEVGMDVAIANFGWIGFACHRTAMIKVYAPNSGVRVTCTPTMALPRNVGFYRTPTPKSADDKKKDKKSSSKKRTGGTNDDDMDLDDLEFDEMDGLDDDDVYLDEMDEFGDTDYSSFIHDGDDYGGGREYSRYDGYDDEFGFSNPDSIDNPRDAERGRKRRWYNPEEYQMGQEDKNDPWARYSGKHVGWQFDPDMRFSKSKTRIEGWNPIFEDDPNKKDDDDVI